MGAGPANLIVWSSGFIASLLHCCHTSFTSCVIHGVKCCKSGGTSSSWQSTTKSWSPGNLYLHLSFFLAVLVWMLTCYCLLLKTIVSCYLHVNQTWKKIPAPQGPSLAGEPEKVLCGQHSYAEGALTQRADAFSGGHLALRAFVRAARCAQDNNN